MSPLATIAARKGTKCKSRSLPLRSNPCTPALVRRIGIGFGKRKNFEFRSTRKSCSQLRRVQALAYRRRCDATIQELRAQRFPSNSRRLSYGVGSNLRLFSVENSRGKQSVGPV